jgi:hypothetical protein
MLPTLPGVSASELLSVFANANHQAQRYIIQIVGEIGDRSVAEQLARMLSDFLSRSKVTLVRELAWGGTGDRAICHDLIIALGKLADYRAAPQLVAQMDAGNKNDEEVRLLVRIGAASVAPLVKRLSSRPDSMLTGAFVSALTQILAREAPKISNVDLTSILQLGPVPAWERGWNSAGDTEFHEVELDCSNLKMLADRELRSRHT